MHLLKSVTTLAFGAFIGVTTARTVQFSIDITAGLLNPTNNDPRPGILVNGTSPGPQLRLKVGDEVHFEARNFFNQDVAIHFHGITQSASPWSDGVPGVTQSPISPGTSFLYRWRAEEAGSFFYHGHSRGHIMDGLYGAIVIDPDVRTTRPFRLIDPDAAQQRSMITAERSLQALLIADYTHLPFEEFDRIENESNVEILCMDSIIVNGGGSEYCLSRKEMDSVTDETVWRLLKLGGATGGLTDKGCLPPLQIINGDFDTNLTALPPRAYDECREGSSPTFTVNVDSRNGWAALSFINSGGQHPLLVSIDSHVMHVFSVDGQYIRPFATDQVAVGNGNRLHVLIKLDQFPGRYTIRLAHQLPNQVLAGFAHLVYNGADIPVQLEPKFNFAGRSTQDITLFDETMSLPYPAVKPAASVDRTHKLLLKKMGAPHNSGEWTMSGVSRYNESLGHPKSPLLFQSPDESSDVLLMTNQDEWVDLIVETEGPIARYHPMHKHGNKFFVLGSGTGRYPWDTVEEGIRALPDGSFNLENPPYLDTVRTKTSVTGAWLVLRYKVEHAGAWLFHCHIQPHLSGGMGMILLDAIDKWPRIPESYAKWNGFDGEKSVKEHSIDELKT